MFNTCTRGFDIGVPNTATKMFGNINSTTRAEASIISLGSTLWEGDPGYMRQRPSPDEFPCAGRVMNNRTKSWLPNMGTSFGSSCHR